MKELLKLTQHIKDKTLRKKVEGFLRDLRLSSRDFRKYPREKLKDAGSLFIVPAPGFGPVERDVIKHTVALTELCMEVVENLEKNFGLKLNRDFLIAASILHDLMKVFEYRRNKKGELEPTGIMLDHTMLAVAELFHRDFPEEVIHIVASHYGESGPTPPKTFEALVFHHLDSFLSILEYYHGRKKRLGQQIVILTEEDMKKLSGKIEKLE